MSGKTNNVVMIIAHVKVVNAIVENVFNKGSSVNAYCDEDLSL